jgi:tetratricopeptide (TPR) repeat protein
MGVLALKQQMKAPYPILAILLPLLLAGAAAQGSDLSLEGSGTVKQWMDLDARFYRTFDDNRWVDRSQFNLEQRGIYQGTFQMRSPLSGIDLGGFTALPEDQKERRRELAADQLAYLDRYLMRVQEQVQRLRENLASGWGDWVSDSTVLGDILLKLRTACALDPSNPQSWHLLSYFSMCAGDEKRALSYLEAADAALQLVPAQEMKATRLRVALDRAWLLRSRGHLSGAVEQLDRADGLVRPGTESLLLRGLIAAQTGRTQEAYSIADRLDRSEIRRFPNNFRTTDFRPELLDPMSWKKGTSSYLADWIKALVLLEEGNLDLARKTFGNYRMDDHYPFAWRFWNAAGHIFEATGRSGEAIRAWNTARINRPWLRNMIYKPYELALGVLTGHDAKVPYMLGYDRFYIAGSRLAFAASLVGRVGSAEGEQEKLEWAGLALEELEVCERAGLYPGQALVLQGHVFYLLGDITSSLERLAASLPHLEKHGDLEVQQAVMKDMNAISRNQQAAEMKALFKQSGNSQGRWRAEADPEGRIVQLEADLEASPGSWPLKRELALLLIRNGRPAEGRALIETDKTHAATGEGLLLLVEADRQLGDAALALKLVKRLARGDAAPLTDPALWSLVGSVCLEQGNKDQAERALQHALSLDPENQGVRMQLRMMGN